MDDNFIVPPCITIKVYFYNQILSYRIWRYIKYTDAQDAPQFQQGKSRKNFSEKKY